MGSIADNMGVVTRRIQKATMAANRPADSVRLLAVSKRKPPEDLRAAAAAGQKAFGENYLQEAVEKMDALADLPDLEWHFIGPIQSNKTRDIAARFDWVHSVDRLKIARRLSDQRPDSLPPLNICLQVNVDNEDTKSGVALADIPALADAVLELPGLNLRGLMAIPDPDQPEASLRQSFRALADMLGRLRQAHPDAKGLDTLSMGMSGDLEIAIAEGATLVRVGTALFGARENPQQT
ncbi:YggS family pyridoxal phosphate-dependent enzyme [Marinobacter halodurans]|uniref:Pyridoxal phosphate homeostasis protein n=1 Tax=Marinobacter halodurans TaxID=2528979 RepID=A0ABY1ZHM0_9GAMM|nr:YggS family pyridoxal phosphate-dependent enzyme [Marinobacter halodurans]TBW52200.1 YggS family pyridoxal phosphate-dependent enzyme [Marinobacter halodurans]